MTVASDEIRLEIQLDVEKDIGLFIIDRDIAGNDFSGGISNVDKSLLKHDELLINNYTKEEFSNVEDLNNLKLRFSIITKYVDPNYENVYPEEYTKVMEPIYIDANMERHIDLQLQGIRKMDINLFLKINRNAENSLVETV